MATTYTQPGKDLSKYTCPHCNTLSQMEKAKHHFESDMYRSA